MSSLKKMTWEVRELLKSTSHEDSTDLLNTEIQQVKERVRSTFTNHVHQLHIREQWLLQQADHIHDCYSNVADTRMQKTAEARGKLQCCADLASFSELNDCESFNNYAREALKAYKALSQQEKTNSIKFVGDEGKLLENIHKFGTISSSDDEDSEFSWEFPDSENVSVTSDKLNGKNIDENAEMKCCGNCIKPSFEIEDVDRCFERMQSPGNIADLCKANEVCESFDDCLCDELCNASIEQHTTFYVGEIQKAFNEITSQECEQFLNESSMPVKETAMTSSGLPIFCQEISSLQKKFSQIMSNEDATEKRPTVGVMPWPVDVVDMGGMPWFVDVVAAQINEILNQPKETTQVITSSPLYDLMQEIDEIVNGDILKNGMNGDDSAIYQPKSYDVIDKSSRRVLDIEFLAKQEKLIVDQKIQSFNTEKSDYEKSTSNEGWSTVEDVHAVITQILNA